VVDCFDALTSDRPYRPKLSDEEALAILRERRGTMYDPMIVDTFFKVHATSPHALARNGPPSEVLNTIAHSRRRAPTASFSASPTLGVAIASADEALTVRELSRALAGVNQGDAADVIARHLRHLIPWSMCVFYLYDSVSGELEARHARGDGASVVRGMRIPLGQRLSGWVGANRQTICNSDAALDLGDSAKVPPIALKSALSTALICDDELIGVLSLYSVEPQGFDNGHRRIIEALAGEIARAFKGATEFDAGTRETLTGLAGLNSLKRFADAT
jgi:putative methionine-R-sulfoxide reductase with GAF domain